MSFVAGFTSLVEYLDWRWGSAPTEIDFGEHGVRLLASSFVEDAP